MSAPVSDAASPGGASHPAKKRKLATAWVGGYDKAAADELLSAKEAENAELVTKLARARANVNAVVRAGAEDQAALKANIDKLKRLAARYKLERNVARTDRDVARTERDNAAQEREAVADESARTLEQCQKSAAQGAAQAAAQAEEKRLALAKRLEDVTKERDDIRRLYKPLRKQYEFVSGELQRCKAVAEEAVAQAEQERLAMAKQLEDVTEERNNANCTFGNVTRKFGAATKELAEAREQCKTARELGRREAAADTAAAQARADNAVESLQAELAKSKSLEEELELVKAQRDTAKKRLAQVAEFQRKQVEMQRMLMSQSFMNLEDGAATSASAGPSVDVGPMSNGLLHTLNSSEIELVD